METDKSTLDYSEYLCESKEKIDYSKYIAWTGSSHGTLSDIPLNTKNASKVINIRNAKGVKFRKNRRSKIMNASTLL